MRLWSYLFHTSQECYSYETNKHLLETDQSKLEKSDDTIKGVNCLVVYCRAFIVKLGCPEFRSLVKLICTHC